jgi:hypothetical protein
VSVFLAGATSESMNQEITVRVYDVIDSPLAVSSNDGQKVYDKIAPLVREGRAVCLSFEKVETIIPAFLNAAVGQLYEEFVEEKIGKFFKASDMSPEDLILLNHVVDSAKRYFANRKEFDQAWKGRDGRWR